MYKLLLGVALGAILVSSSHALLSLKENKMGAVPSNGEMIGVYNSSPNDLNLPDGSGSALLTDKNGRVITTKP